MTQNLEDGPLVEFVDANSRVIHDEDDQAFLLVVLNVDVYGSTETVVNCILDNVNSDLLQPVGVTNH